MVVKAVPSYCVITMQPRRDADIRVETATVRSSFNMECIMDVGFIGLGHTGQPVALNLLKAGHPLVV